MSSRKNRVYGMPRSLGLATLRLECVYRLGHEGPPGCQTRISSRTLFAPRSVALDHLMALLVSFCTGYWMDMRRANSRIARAIRGSRVLAGAGIGVNPSVPICYTSASSRAARPHAYRDARLKPGGVA